MYNKSIKIKNYKIQKLEYTNPVHCFEKFSNKYGSVLFTGHGNNTNSKYSIIGTSPNFEFQYQIIDTDNQSSSDIWKSFKELLNYSEFHKLEYPANMCGLIGFSTYELGRDVEILPKTTIDSYKCPIVQILAYKTYYIFDNLEKLTWKIDFEYEHENKFNLIKEDGSSFKITNLSQESTPEEYLQKVKKIQDYIVKGDVYEVNLTQQISGDFKGNPFSLFKQLFLVNDAPYSCYFNLGKIKIISNSPEMFLKVNKKQIETRPIKGTISRSIDPEKDQQNRLTLLNSEKDQAELFMIIDLLRNDLGKIAEIGTVKVRNVKKLEPFKNVYHLVGIVEAILDNKYDYIDLIKATFPGGSITGCPKIRSMEIIDEIETFTRNLYTGSIFIINQEYLNSSIVIRTAIINEDNIFINSGGAITIDSDPEDEYKEMQTKIKNIMELLN